MYDLVNSKGFVHPLIGQVFVVSMVKSQDFLLALKPSVCGEHEKITWFLVSLETKYLVVSTLKTTRL